MSSAPGPIFRPDPSGQRCPSPEASPGTKTLGCLALLSALLLVSSPGCSGSGLNSGATPTPPGDPHQQEDPDATIYWETLQSGSSPGAIYAIAGLGPTDVWLTGEGGQVWSWQGSSLTLEAELTTSTGDIPRLYGLWLSSDAQGRVLYVVGERGSIFRYGFNSDGFVQEETNTLSAFKSITGFARNDIWAAGDGGVYHFDGSGWTRDTAVPGSAQLEALWGTDSSSLFAVGDGGALYARDPAGWSRVSLGRSEDLHAVWGSGPSDVFAAGQNGLILHFDGSSWSFLDSGSFEHLWGIRGLSSSRVFAVGTNGTALYFDGAAWRRLATGTHFTLYGLWGSDLEHVLAVGAWSTLLRFDEDVPLEGE